MKTIKLSDYEYSLVKTIVQTKLSEYKLKVLMDHAPLSVENAKVFPKFGNLARNIATAALISRAMKVGLMADENVFCNDETAPTSDPTNGCHHVMAGSRAP